MLSRALASTWCGEGSVPDNPAWGERYPERTAMLHIHTRAHRSRVDAAKRIVERANEDPHTWRLGLSCGKDSTALALLLHDMGATMTAMSVKDDLDYPGEEVYARTLSARCGLELEVLRPRISLQAFLVEQKISLVNDLHSRAAELSREHFYALLDQHRAAMSYDAVMLGLRMEESRGRKMNALAHGTLYTRKRDGLTVCQPLAGWKAIDVHAFLMSHDVPLLPVYGCLDPGMTWLEIRKSWWVAGGYASSIGSHYAWLRRWWPVQWERAVEIDPDVGRFS